MAENDLAFGSTIICVAATNDNYTRLAAKKLPTADTRDIVFANTAGREIRIAGSQSMPNSALTVSYGQSPFGQTCVYKSSIANMNTWLATIQTHLTTGTSMLQTLTDRDNETMTGMRIVNFTPGTPSVSVTRNGEEFVLFFGITFAKYTV